MSIWSSIADILPIKRTELFGDAKDTVVAFFSLPDREDEDTNIPESQDESAAVDWWQHYGFVSRPPEGTEGLILRMGQQAFAIASRMVSAAGILGQLSAGDVAVFSVGKNLIKLGSDGSIAAMRETSAGKKMICIMTKDDAIKFVIPDGPVFEMSAKNGIVMNAGNKNVTLAGKQVTLNGTQVILNSGCTKLHAAAVTPLISGVITIPNVFT